MFPEIDTIFNLSITIEEVIASLLVAFVCGMVISGFYRIIYKSSGFSVSFLYTLVILTMITSIVIITIGDNLARAFGLVGAMSIIRFRTAVKETHDIMFIFFALAIGLSVGVGLYSVALTSSIIIGAATFFLDRSKIFLVNRKKYLLQFTYQQDDENTEKNYTDILKKYCKSYDLINMKSLHNTNIIELSFYIEFRNEKNSSIFVKTMQDLPGINHINVFFENTN